MVTSAGLKVLFWGTPEFAAPPLRALLGEGFEVVGVVTQPDRPRGRGQKETDAPVKARAREVGLPILQPSTLKDPAVVQALAAFGARTSRPRRAWRPRA